MSSPQRPCSVAVNTVLGALAVVGSLAAAPGVAPAQAVNNNRPKITWLWHMHQPIYWNDRTRWSATDRYEFARESIAFKNSNPGARPENDLDEIFGKDDRRAAYQYRPKDSLAAVSFAPNSGAAITIDRKSVV